MAVYEFDRFIVLDESGRPAVDAEGNVYAASDDAFTTPLSVTDLSGLPLVLKVDAFGLAPAFQVEHTEPMVVWKSGTTAAITLLSVKSVAQTAGKADEALSTAQTAQTSASAAASSAASAEAAAVALAPDGGAKAVGKGELVVNVKDFGAVGDGVVDDTLAIQAALTAAAASSGRVDLAPGVYKSGPLTIPSGVTLAGRGRGATTLVPANPSSTTDSVIGAAGTVGAKVALTADAAPGARTLTMGSTSGFAAGDWLLLVDDSVPDPAYPTRHAGEMVQVESVTSSTVLTLRTSANLGTTPPGIRGAFGASGWAAYQTALGAGVCKVAPVESVRVSGLTIRNPAQGTGAVSGMTFNAVVGLSIDDVEVAYTDGPAVNMSHVAGFIVSDCYFHDLTDDEVNGRYGYGVNVGGGTQQGIVSGCLFERLRHAFTTNGNTTGGIPQHITVSDCRAYQTHSTAFDTHGAGAYIRFSDCVSADSDGYAFVARARYLTFQGCEAIRPKLEGFMQITDVPRANRFIGCLVREGLRAGIELRGLTDDTELADMMVDGCGTSGIRVGYGSQNVRIVRPRVYNVGQDAASQGIGVEVADTGSGTPVTTGLAILGGLFARTKSYEGDDDYRNGVSIPTTAVVGAYVADNHGWGLRGDVNFVIDSGSGTVLYNNGPWDRADQRRASIPALASTALLAASGRANAAKRAGDAVFDTTLNRPLWASGSTTTSPWVDATGATVHTPA